MRKSVEHRLFAKVFFITAALLFFVGFLTYGLLAWLTPGTYANQLQAVLDEQARAVVAELEQAAFEERGGLFEQLLQNPKISDVELYDESGSPVPLYPSEMDASYMAAEATSEPTYGEADALTSNSYYFSFADSEARYMLLVYGDGAPIAELRQAFLRVFPALILISLLTALFFAFFYAAVIMQLQNKNRRLAEDMAREKEQERQRLDFFSAVSHELKTPVTVIKGQLEGMLLGIGAYRDRETYLARALAVANTLERLVQELLTVSRLETEDADLKNEWFDAAALIRDYLNETEDFAMHRRLEISCEMPQTALLYGNRLLLEKVFSNLIANAMEYSPEGAQIRIAAHLSQRQFAFSVENTGAHIPGNCIPKLFDAFYRVEQSRNKTLGGSGLGLYLVQKILALYGSRCEGCNTPEGVRFSFVLENKNANMPK